MLRPLLVVALPLLCVPGSALGQTEADRRICAEPANLGADARIDACTRLLADQRAAPGLRTLAYRGRGIAYGHKKLHELAILDFDEALKLSPRDRLALGYRGRALFQMGQYDRAMADYNEVIRLYPRSDRAYNERGLVFSRTGNQDAALSDYESAIRINPRNVFAHNNRGLVLAKRGQLDDAIAEYTEALRIDPDHLLAYTNRARAYEDKGAADLALTDFKVAAERDVALKTDDDARARASAKQHVARLTTAIAEGKVGPKSPPERRVALVIGNSAYAHAPPLRNPANDARALAAVLRNQGFSDVRELIDAGLGGLGKALKDFGDVADGADWALIYYAGHGIEVGGTNYLIPVDAVLEQQAHVEDEAVPLPRVLSKVRGAGRLQLVILDACRNNPFVPRMRQSGNSARAIGRGLASIEPESGVLVAYAARDGTTALDGEGANSPYAEALAKYIPEPGLEISLLFRKVRDDVFSKTGRQQEPYTYGSLPAQAFYFKR